MFKYSLIFLFSLYSRLSLADTAMCTVDIQEVTSGAKQKIEHAFTFKLGSNEAQRKHFELSDNSFTCTLALFNLNTGTMLSCEFDELGHNFVQSDRSAINENHSKNNLSFRYNTVFYVLKSACK
jgi:phosphate-selective porin